MLPTVVPFHRTSRLASFKRHFLFACLAALLNLSFPLLAQPGGLAGGLGGDAEPSLEVSCPNWGEPDTCGQGVPDESMLAGPLDGTWDVSAPGAPYVGELAVILNTRYGLFHRGNPNIPSPAQAMWRLQWEEAMGVPFAVSYQELEGGGFSVRMGRFEACTCVSIEYRVYPTGNPDVLRGEWQYQKRTGPTQWRRRDNGARVRSVTLYPAMYDSAGQPVTDAYDIRDKVGKISRPGGVACGAGMRGNCQSVWMTLLGDNFAGPHQVWIDPSHYMEIGEVGWVCSDGRYYSGGWGACGNAGSNVGGIRVEFILWDGMKSGPVNLWVNGRPVPLELEIGPAPDEDDIPALVSVTAYDTAGDVVTTLQQNGIYRFEAVFEENHPHAWINVSLAAPEGAPDDQPRNVTLARAADKRTFSSDWLQLKRDDTVEMP